MPNSTTKIAIVGAGSVGATIAYACLIRGVAKRIADELQFLRREQR